MPHPRGSTGNILIINNTFARAYAFIGSTGFSFLSTTGETMIATQGFAQDRVTRTIVLNGQRNVHGRVCESCWGYMTSCTGERISQAVTPLDSAVV